MYEPTSIPNSFLCPILQEVMKDPVSAADGHSYERAAITEWLDRGNHTSPLTNARLADRTLVPNHALRTSIEEVMENAPERQKHQATGEELKLAIQRQERYIAMLEGKLNNTASEASAIPSAPPEEPEVDTPRFNQEKIKSASELNKFYPNVPASLGAVAQKQSFQKHNQPATSSEDIKEQIWCIFVDYSTSVPKLSGSKQMSSPEDTLREILKNIGTLTNLAVYLVIQEQRNDPSDGNDKLSAYRFMAQTLCALKQYRKALDGWGRKYKATSTHRPEEVLQLLIFITNFMRNPDNTFKKQKLQQQIKNTSNGKLAAYLKEKKVPECSIHARLFKGREFQKATPEQQLREFNEIMENNGKEEQDDNPQCSGCTLQ